MRTKFTYTIISLFFLFIALQICSISHVFAGATCVSPNGSGGYDKSFEKLESVGNLSYNYLIPLGKFGKCGDFRGAGYSKNGHGVDIELLYYFEADDMGDFRLGIGFSDQLFFFPLCTPDVNAKLDQAFAADTLAHTQYKTPDFNSYKAFGMSAQINTLYMWDQFSLEGTFKAGPMAVISPGYTTQGGNYVPVEYSYLFQEQLNPKTTWTYYLHAGINANFYFAEHIGIFAGGGFSYTRPVFKNEMMNVHIENGSPVVERQATTHIQSMPFLQLRAGVTFHIGKWE